MSNPLYEQRYPARATLSVGPMVDLVSASAEAFDQCFRILDFLTRQKHGDQVPVWTDQHADILNKSRS
ncbi:MAG TPA: hypothetical protein VLK56_02285 [Solirubrobacterales bacterium]|nr:hypothetical protein [Solirubrobacterales bacterium]